MQKIHVRSFGREGRQILAELAREYRVPVVEWPRRWWQLQPRVEVVLPFQDARAYRLFCACITLRFGALSNSGYRVWVAEQEQD